MKQILEHKLARELLVYNVSRLFRDAHLGYAFFTDHVVEEGLRAVSITQNIDTADEKRWQLLALLFGQTRQSP